MKQDRQEVRVEEWEDAPVNAEPEPTPEKHDEPALIRLEQFCSSMQKSVPVETLSLFYELEYKEDRYWGTYEEYKQRLVELQNRPL